MSGKKKNLSEYPYSIAPIVLFVYNRPWHTHQTVEALAKNELAGKSDLIIYSDGPKTEADKPAVEAVRQYIYGLVGFKKVIIRERDKNFGLADSIISGVTEVVNEYDRVIVLEDDLVTSSFFLQYMNDALDKYKDYDDVMQISGHMFPCDLSDESEAVFLPFSTTWGWGTWKCAWGKLDMSAKNFEMLKKNKQLRNEFNLNGSYDYFRLYKKRYKRENNSWGIFWYSSVFFNKGIVLFPVQTLVTQIGFDDFGTHCGGINLPQQMLAEKPVEHLPDEPGVDGEIYRKFIKDFKDHHIKIKRLHRVAALKKIVFFPHSFLN